MSSIHLQTFFSFFFLKLALDFFEVDTLNYESDIKNVFLMKGRNVHLMAKQELPRYGTNLQQNIAIRIQSANKTYLIL